MRITTLYDSKITNEELDQLELDFADIFVKNAQIDPVFFRHARDYNFYPTYIDSDGDVRPSNSFLVQETDFVHKKYGQWGTDHIVILIHEDNWQSGKIWGTAFANLYHGYQVTYCRLDRDNPANSLGTLYHEIMHTFDTLVKTELNVTLEFVVGVEDYDRDLVHGKSPKYDYIRHKENQGAVFAMGPYLRKAYAQRKARYDKEVGMYKSIVQLLQTLIVLLRQQIIRKNGINKLCSKLFH